MMAKKGQGLVIAGALAAGGVGFLYVMGRRRVKRCCPLDRGPKEVAMVVQKKCFETAGGSFVDTLKLGFEELAGLSLAGSQVPIFKTWCEMNKHLLGQG